MGSRGTSHIAVLPSVAHFASAAGANGPFMTPTPGSATAFQPLIGTPTPPTPANLLSSDRPTLLTRWLFTSIYLPMVILDTVEENVSFVGTAQLVVNGSRRWTGSVAMFSAIASGQQVAGGVVTDDLVNPIQIDRGDSMVLQVAFQATPAVTGGLQVWVGAQLNNGVLQGANGALIYDINDRPGIRTL